MTPVEMADTVEPDHASDSTAYPNFLRACGLPSYLCAMSGVGREDDRDTECLKLLIEHGVQSEDARHVLSTIKATFDIDAVPAEPLDAESDVAFQFRRGTKKAAGKGHKVAGATFEEFKWYADAHLWLNRTDQGYPWKCDVFEFIADVYGEWIERGVKAEQPLAQADIKAVDLALYSAFHRANTARGVPSWLYLPAAKDAALVGITEAELALRLSSRELAREVRTTRLQHAAAKPDHDI